jgi:hypothetical protein
MATRKLSLPLFSAKTNVSVTDSPAATPAVHFDLKIKTLQQSHSGLSRM